MSSCFINGSVRVAMVTGDGQHGRPVVPHHRHHIRLLTPGVSDRRGIEGYAGDAGQC